MDPGEYWDAANLLLYMLDCRHTHNKHTNTYIPYSIICQSRVYQLSALFPISAVYSKIFRIIALESFTLIFSWHIVLHNKELWGCTFEGFYIISTFTFVLFLWKHAFITQPTITWSFVYHFFCNSCVSNCTFHMTRGHHLLSSSREETDRHAFVKKDWSESWPVRFTRKFLCILLHMDFSKVARCEVMRSKPKTPGELSPPSPKLSLYSRKYTLTYHPIIWSALYACF